MYSASVQRVIDQHAARPFHLLKAEAFSGGIRAEYGQVYTLQDIRDNVRLGNVPALSIRGETCMVVGEAPGKILLRKADGMTASFSDTDMAHLWPGEATIFFASDKLGDKYKKRNTILLDGIRSEWNDSERQDAALQAINKLESVPTHMLPAHPVILVLQEKLPEDQIEFKNGVTAESGIRAYSIGASIFLIDKSDPMTEMYHELGHIFWGRLTDAEKKTFIQLHGTIDRKRPPGIIQSSYEISHHEEFFCTLYMWAIKGAAISAGYQEILDSQCPDGAGLLRGVFSRIEQEIESERIWDENRAALASGIRTLSERPQNVMVGGSSRRVRLVKADFAWPDLYKIPESKIGRTLSESNGVEYVTVKDELLEDIAIPVRRDEDGVAIAYDVLQKAGRKAGTVPIHTVRAKPGVGIVLKQEYRYPSELRPEDIEETVELAKAKRAKVGEIREWSGKLMQRQDGGAWAEVEEERTEPDPRNILQKARDLLRGIWNDINKRIDELND
jgi:hypothetical protein